MKVTTLGIDLAKNVFQLNAMAAVKHGAAAGGLEHGDFVQVRRGRAQAVPNPAAHDFAGGGCPLMAEFKNWMYQTIAVMNSYTNPSTWSARLAPVPRRLLWADPMA